MPGVSVRRYGTGNPSLRHQATPALPRGRRFAALDLFAAINTFPFRGNRAHIKNIWPILMGFKPFLNGFWCSAEAAGRDLFPSERR
jgi:hypothetical protein